MQTIPTAIIWVCACCFLAAVNGEPCQCCADHEEDEPCQGCDEHPNTLMGSISAEDNVTAGMLTSEHEEACKGDQRVNSNWQDRCDCAIKTFSTSQCDGCGSYLHGERHAMTLWIGENKSN